MCFVSNENVGQTLAQNTQLNRSQGTEVEAEFFD